ncbi:hypothetical protein H1R87_00135 [Flavobacterium psychrophilum]|nr:hypothetical protein H1R87_00135 [Flavobacterium psychrophilum]
MFTLTVVVAVPLQAKTGGATAIVGGVAGGSNVMLIEKTQLLESLIHIV